MAFQFHADNDLCLTASLCDHLTTVPAYNEENRLPTMLDETLGYLLRRASPAAAAAANAPAAPGAPTGERFSFEVIVVDDGSRDGTVAVAEEYARRAEATKGLPRGALRVLRLSRNGGKGAAVRRGALATRGKLLLMADADGATAVADLAKLERDLYRALRERALEDERAGRGAADAGVVGAVDVGSRLGVAVGSRAHLQGKALAERKAHRNLLMHAFHFLVQRCSGTTIRDTQCGFKLFTRRAATCLFANQRLTRWGFDVELLYIAKQLGIPVAESPVRWVEMPGSKLNILGMLHTGLEVMAIPLAYSTRMWQVRLPPET